MDEEEIRGSQSREDTSSPPASIHLVGKPRTEKQSYASIAMSKSGTNPRVTLNKGQLQKSEMNGKTS